MNTVKTYTAGLFLILLAACGASSNSSTTDGVQLLSSEKFAEKMVNLADYNLLDVRSPEEFATNHIKGAQNIDVNGGSFDEKIALLDKNKPVLVYCKSGGRSATASEKLNKLGLETYELENGILDWQSKNLPVEANAKKSNSGYTLESYNSAVSEGLVLVDFYATWCGPCKMMAPHVEALKMKYGEGLTVVKVDTDKSMEVSQHFKINAIPLVKVYKDGVETYSKEGYHSQEELQAVLDKNS